MRGGPIQLRRARRTDFIPITKVLANAGAPTPVPDRATLRRFRRLVADQGADAYVAVADPGIVGFVHVTYARQLAGAARARIESLVVHGEHAREAASSLVALAVRRARRRGCAELFWIPGTVDAAGAMDREVWRPAGDVFYFGLSDEQAAGDE